MNIKIPGVKLEKKRNDEHMQFHTEHIAVADECEPDTLGIRPLFDEYKVLFDEEDLALKKVVKSDYTRLIKDADKERDNIYGGMVHANKANAKHYEPEVKAAGIRIQIALDTYGNLSRKPLNEQTSAITNILQDLRGKYADDVAVTGIGGWVNELERTNNAVVALVKERADETVSRVTIVLAEARAKVDAAFRKIAERINAAVIIEGPEKYETYIRRLNEIIDRYAAAIKIREGRAAKKRATGAGGQ